jgi:hypothetical protein
MPTRSIRQTGVPLYLSTVGLFVGGGFALWGLAGAAAGGLSVISILVVARLGAD